jgi:hypothetical protein
MGHSLFVLFSQAGCGDAWWARAHQSVQGRFPGPKVNA